MVLIFTGNDELDRDLSKKITNSRIVYYPDYVLKEPKASILILAVQENKFDYKNFIFNVRERDIRIILLLENEKVKELKDALLLGIYDIIFDPFDLDEVCSKIKKPSQFSNVSKYLKDILDE